MAGAHQHGLSELGVDVWMPPNAGWIQMACFMQSRPGDMTSRDPAVTAQHGDPWAARAGGPKHGLLFIRNHLGIARAVVDARRPGEIPGMHVPFSENHPCVLTDRKRTETRPNSEGQAPVDVATARCVASCFMNKPAAALRAFSFGKTGEIVGIHRHESPASGQFNQRPACRSSVEKAMVVTDNGKEMANKFYTRHSPRGSEPPSPRSRQRLVRSRDSLGIQRKVRPRGQTL